MAANVELWIRVDNSHYEHALSIPTNDCQRFSVHPPTWLRYLGFTICGTQGHISRSPEGGTEIEYLETTIQAGDYYYIAQGAFFLLDPDLMEDRTSNETHSTDSPRQSDFRKRVVNRDRTCIMTNESPQDCRACHIVPHANGEETKKYLITLANQRHKVLDPPLEDIDDTRNGILLASHLHRSFGDSEVAFLQTPNFAMTDLDVDRVTQPGVTPPPGIKANRRRLTFQHFNMRSLTVEMTAPHNSDARISDSDEWPPSLVFDVAYGCAAVKTWGLAGFTDFLRGRTKDIYYNGGDSRGDRRTDERTMQETRERNERVSARRREMRGQSKASQDPNVADIVMGLWIINARKGQRQAQAVNADRNREKVRTWLDSTG